MIYSLSLFAIYIVGMKFTLRLFLLARKSINRSSTEQFHVEVLWTFFEIHVEVLWTAKNA